MIDFHLATEDTSVMYRVDTMCLLGATQIAVSP